jgi:hypothetical protein
MPVLVFTSRHMEILNNGGNRWVSTTQGIQKASGLWAYDSGSRPGNGNPWFTALQIDLKSRTINLVGASGSVQFYVDEGKGPPAYPQGAMNGAGNGDRLTAYPNPYDTSLNPYLNPYLNNPYIIDPPPRLERQVPEKRR